MNRPHLCIETSSFCNRSCASCLRQNYPDRERVAPWFDQHVMPIWKIKALLREAKELGYTGPVGFNHYNEALLDPRIAEIGRLARETGFTDVSTITNGDALDDQKAAELDGIFTKIAVSLYNGDVREEAKVRITGWFTKTTVVFTRGLHRMTHWCGLPGLKERIDEVREIPCYRAHRNFIVNHQGDCLLCCEEMVPHFDLGNVYDSPLSDLWFSKHRQEIIADLGKPGGRLKYQYCATCPSSRSVARRFCVA